MTALIVPVAVPAIPAAAADATAAPGVYTWGYNDVGQLGDGTTTNHYVPAPVTALSAGAQRVFVNYDAGFEAAVNADGTVSAWGHNSHGQLGDGTTTDRHSPVAVQGLTGITQIAGGKLQLMFLSSDGTVWASGDNELGQLGDGTTTDRHSPVAVQGLTGVTQIASGIYTSFALRSDGTVWAWGYGGYGQLGDGTTASSLVPRQVPGLTGITQIAAGVGDAFALRSNGTLMAWGDNDTGQLGDGTTTERLSPVPVPGLSGVTQVSAGGDHTLAITGGGQVWAWGDNTYGQLGDGTTTEQDSPEQISLSGVTQVQAGYQESAAVSADGTLLLWGYNPGTLGLSPNNPLLTPMTVPGVDGVAQAQIASGDVIALSSPPVSVPDVRGQTQAPATAALQAAGLNVTVARLTGLSECAAAEQGQVVSMSPGAGSAEPAESTVNVNVCALPEHQIPDVTGEPLATAQSTLSALHFYPLPFGVTCSTHDRAVTFENPKAGLTKPIGTGIILQYCS